MNFDNLTDKEKGYLFGLFEGDGYKIYDKKSRHYHVEFYLNSLKDNKIIFFIVNLLKTINLNPQLYQDKRCHCKRIRVYSKDLFNILEKGKSFDNFSKNFKLGFVSGLIDSEGYVNKEKSFIRVVNTNKRILVDTQKFLDSIKIPSSVNIRNFSRKDKLKSYRMYISVNFKRLKHLSIKAGILSR